MNNSKVKNFLLLVSINQINKFSFLNVHELSFLQSLEITITPSKKKKKKKIIYFFFFLYKNI